MYSKVLFATILTTVIAFGASTAMADDPNTTQNQNTSQPAADPSAQQKDGQILKTLMVLNKGEINAGKLAQAQSSNQAIKKFAQQMVKDHSKNLKDAEALANKLNITPVDSDTSTNLQNKSDEEATKLKSLNGSDFDQEYASAMVNGHQDALNMLNDAISQANNPKLVAYLKATRDKVEHHLKMAQELSKKISQS